MYKYRINELLTSLPVKDYRKALKIIPKVLGVSLNTFTNYRNIKLHEDRDIPHQKVALLESIFGIKPGELEGYRRSRITIRDLLDECKCSDN